MKLLEINNLNTIAEDDHNKHILKGLDLEINEGEIHVIMGPNGSGKSTLANTIFSSPRYIKTDGTIKFLGEDITNESTTDVAKKGIFMSFQTPVEIPGVTVANMLSTVMKSIDPDNASISKIYKEVNENCEKINMDKSYISREFNVGFSGGEKKKDEMLQMLVFNPKLAILDETDSGLDVDAIKAVVNGIKTFKNDKNAILIITHSTKILEDLNVDKVHVLLDGRIVETGDISLAKKIDKEGYKSYEN